MTNHYLVLGVERNASQAEIEAAFLGASAFSSVFNGVVGRASKHGARLEEAYAVLRDPRSRAAYDETLRRG